MSDHEIFPDRPKPTFVPSPGRVVLVRRNNGDILPGLVVMAASWDRVLVSVHTGDPASPVEPDWYEQRKDENGTGWYRPGDWPQPTMGG